MSYTDDQDPLGGNPLPERGGQELLTNRLLRRQGLTNFADLEPKTQWAIVGGTFAVAMLAFFFALAAFFVAGREPKQSSDLPKETATVPSYEEQPQQPKQQRPRKDTTMLASAQRPARTVTSEPAPAESAPARATERGESAPVFAARIASDFSGVVSYTLAPDGNEKAVQAFDALIAAIGGKFEAADGAERVYSRNSVDQTVNSVGVVDWVVIVEMKTNPDKEFIDRLTKPIQELATALGLPAEGTWTSDGPKFVYKLKNPAVIPPGKTK